MDTHAHDNATHDVKFNTKYQSMNEPVQVQSMLAYLSTYVCVACLRPILRWRCIRIRICTDNYLGGLTFSRSVSTAS